MSAVCVLGCARSAKWSDDRPRYNEIGRLTVTRVDLATAAEFIGRRGPRLEQPTVPERILRHLEAIERMAKTASHTVDFLKKLAGLCLILACLVTVVKVGNASSEHQYAGADRDREIAAAVRIVAERMELLHGDNAQNKKALVELIEQLERIGK